jgi:hypothetical protein
VTRKSGDEQDASLHAGLVAALLRGSLATFFLGFLGELSVQLHDRSAPAVFAELAVDDLAATAPDVPRMLLEHAAPFTSGSWFRLIYVTDVTLGSKLRLYLFNQFFYDLVLVHTVLIGV